MYEKYAAIRDAKGLKDSDVSRMSGVATATLSSWKSGAYKPKIEKLLAIAKVLGVSIEELI